MNDILFIVCVSVICALALVLIVWILVELFRINRNKAVKGKLVTVEGEEYELVPLGEAPSNRHAASETPAVAKDSMTVTDAATEKEEPSEEETDEPAQEGTMVNLEEDGVVLLKRNEAVPYPQAYENLNNEQKGYVDEIIAHAETKEGVKKVVNDKSASVYLGKKLVVRILLKRGAVYARLTVQNNNFAAYTDNAGLNIKEKPIEIKVDRAEMVPAVKDIIDISYGDLSAERERREEEKKAQRRESRRQARAALLSAEKENSAETEE